MSYIHKKIVTKVCSWLTSPVFLGANLPTFMTMLSSTPSEYPFTLSQMVCTQSACVYRIGLMASVILPQISNIKQIDIGLQWKRCTLMEVRAQEEKKNWDEIHLAKGKHFSRSDNCTLKLPVSLCCLLRDPRVTKSGLITCIVDILNSIRWTLPSKSFQICQNYVISSLVFQNCLEILEVSFAESPTQTTDY